MSLVALILILLLIAGIYWLVNYKIPTPSPFKWIINFVLIVVAVLLVLSAFGVLDELRGIRVPKI